MNLTDISRWLWAEGDGDGVHQIPLPVERAGTPGFVWCPPDHLLTTFEFEAQIDVNEHAYPVLFGSFTCSCPLKKHDYVSYPLPDPVVFLSNFGVLDTPTTNEEGPS